ncbi:hydrolase [Sphingobacterium sp. N143]|uniref:glycoside hydrolase family 76 protein n=1 Tax=Sphingobacterium sp. N143 TaxID=2746727 RepID=UPI00257811AF|nr:glycoside hydrolase family 76 protein [Sphingobacterium sp. N143]MDM1292751.1 hydrolase [Sphingobacterium sp. N143]
MIKFCQLPRFLILSVLVVLLQLQCINWVSLKATEKSFAVCSQDRGDENLFRAIQLIDRSMATYFADEELKMYRFYNPFSQTRSEETASVWMYSSAIEAVNAVLNGLQAQQKRGDTRLYNAYYGRYVELIAKLYTNAAYYLGTFTLTSFTQHKEWTVYAVDRSKEKGKANVEGIFNVYDDQMWLVKELLETYHLTGKENYLKEAEYLTAYILDGWDCTLDEQGKEHGGIPWGPGYVTKHACSNAPIISPLVTLHEIYKNKSDQITKHYISTKDKLTRLSKIELKSDFYLHYAQRIYEWQKDNLLNDNGVYADMMGDCSPACSIAYEMVQGKQYRKNTVLNKAVGTAFSYNCGTMLSAAADLYRVTKSEKYLVEGKTLADASFNYFGKLGQQIPGYYSYANDGFNNWFNGVLLKGFSSIYPLYGKATLFMDSFQKNLDYGYANFLVDGLLPADLLAGWPADKNKCNLEAMFMFAYATQYAVLAQTDMTRPKIAASSNRSISGQ